MTPLGQRGKAVPLVDGPASEMAEATSALREFVNRIVAYLAEQRGHFGLELHGLLAAPLNIALLD